MCLAGSSQFTLTPPSVGMANESCIWLTPEVWAELEGWVVGRDTPQKLVWRARIVLMWADGAGVTAIVRAEGLRQPFQRREAAHQVSARDTRSIRGGSVCLAGPEIFLIPLG